MTRNDLTQLSQDELIDLVLAHVEQNVKLQAEIEALRLKLEKGKKPPTNSGNSSSRPREIKKATCAETQKT